MLVEPLEWDSDFFGFAVGQVICEDPSEDFLEAIISECTEEGVRCLYVKVSEPETTKNLLFSKSGLTLVDQPVLLRKNLREGVDVPRLAAGAIQPAEGTDLDGVRELARVNHSNSRFFVDPLFPREKSMALYARWIDRAWQKCPDGVFVARSGDSVVGYITCELCGSVENSGRIGLVGVAATHRGRGFGAALVLAACTFFQEQGRWAVEVVTQGDNLSALRLYNRLGFCAVSKSACFHRWFESGRVEAR